MTYETSVLREDRIAARTIKILSHNENLWRVQILFPSLEASDSDMVERLRQAKSLIYSTYGIPTRELELEEVLCKTQLQDNVAVDVSICKIPNESDRPVVQLKAKEAADGKSLENMLATIDFSYRDDTGAEIALERLRQEIERAGVNLELCDWDALETERQRVVDQRSYAKRFVIARGKLPEVGKDAELEYTFFSEMESADDLKDYREHRKVKPGDILCQKFPATIGKEPGYDVKGKTLPPQRGFDFELVAGLGVELSYDGTLMTATLDGIAYLERHQRTVYTKTGEKQIPEKVEINVKPLVQLDADQINNACIGESVEITGNLKAGTRIDVDGEVFLQGDVEKGAILHAGANLVVDGNIDGGELTSDDSIHTTRDARESRITARGDVAIAGTAEDSVIVGRQVSVGSVQGSEIVASQKVDLKHVGNDAKGKKSTIRLGKREFYQKRINANCKVLDNLNINLQKIVDLFGEECINQLENGSVQHVLLRFIKEQRTKGAKAPSEARMTSLKKLLESVHSIKRIIHDKNNEIEILTQRIEQEDDTNPVVLIREKVNDHVNLTMGKKRSQIKPSSQGTVITTGQDGELKTRPLRQPDMADDRQ